MSKVKQVDVRALAALSRLSISDEEASRLEKDVEAILGFVAQVQNAPAASGEGSVSLKNVLREDAEPHESGIYTDALLAAAPKTKDGRIVVKQVISKKKS